MSYRLACGARCILEKCSSFPFLPPAAQGNISEAEPLYRRSLSIREKGLGPEHSDVATSLSDLAGVLAQQARTVVAFATVPKVAEAAARRSLPGLSRVSPVSVPQSALWYISQGLNPYSVTIYVFPVLVTIPLSRRAKNAIIIVYYGCPPII